MKTSSKAGRGGNGGTSAAPLGAWLKLRIGTGEFDRARAAARRAGLGLSEWARRELARASKRARSGAGVVGTVQPPTVGTNEWRIVGTVARGTEPGNVGTVAEPFA